MKLSIYISWFGGCSEVPCGQTRGPTGIKLTLSCLTNHPAFSRVSGDGGIRLGHQKCAPQVLGTLIGKLKFQITSWMFMKILMKSQKTKCTKIAETLSSFAYRAAYLAGSADINLGNFIQSINFLPKKLKWSYLLTPARHVHNVLVKDRDLFSHDIEAFTMQVLGHFSVSSKCSEALNEMLEFTEWKERVSLAHLLERWLSLFLDIKWHRIMFAWHKITFSKSETKGMSFYNLEIHWGWEWRKVQ